MVFTFCCLFFARSIKNQPSLPLPKTQFLYPKFKLLHPFAPSQILKGHLLFSNEHHFYAQRFMVYNRSRCAVRNHLNIKSLGNYSGIHPSLITPRVEGTCKNDCWKDKLQKTCQLTFIRGQTQP